MSDILEYIEGVLRRDFGNAQDSLLRAEIEQRSRPYDHDNNDAAKRYSRWKEDARKAISYIGALRKATEK